MSTFTPAPIKPTANMSALDALDIRVGTIERVEPIPHSEKLMRLTGHFGDHPRTILAGIRKERENPREIEGKQALFVVNLEPRRMAGELSEGLLLDIGYADKITPVLAQPERPVPNGTRAGRVCGGGVTPLLSNFHPKCVLPHPMPCASMVTPVEIAPGKQGREPSHA